MWGGNRGKKDTNWISGYERRVPGYGYPDTQSTGREVSATNSPRRLEAPKLHNPIAIRLNLLLDSMMEN